MAVIGLGLASAVVIMKFTDDVIYATIRMKETWKCAFELTMLYLREIDMDVTGRLSLANVFRRGGQDTLLAEARRNAGAFFRTLGGNPRGEDPPTKTDVKPSGEFNKTSDKCCQDFNMGRPCKRLDASGKCLFNHKCNQFVSDKGPKGVCFGDHARCNGCDYDASKKLSKPATQ